VNAGVRLAFPGHFVRTVAESGWRSSKDGPLLALAQDQFDIFVTIDSSLEHQNNLKKLNLGFVIPHVPSNEIASYRPLFDQLKAAAETVQPGDVFHVPSPEST
jgi:hypothetical protein